MKMIYSFGQFSYKKIYFASKPSFICGYNTEFLETRNSNKHLGFIKLPVYTEIINLKNNLDSIKSNFCKSTLRDIKKANKENIKFIADFKDYEFFTNIYNQFVKSRRNLKFANPQLFLKNPELFFMTACSFKDDILVMHLYMIDNEIRRARIFKSVSQYFRLSDNKARSFNARANKYLHFMDMKYFKEQGFLTYDFGGYSYTSDNPKINSINEFKRRFGGEIVTEYDYIPIHKYFFEKIKLTRLIANLINL